MDSTTFAPVPAPGAPQAGPEVLIPKYNAGYLLEMFEQYKKECFEFRWVWEREWTREQWYCANRMWIYYNASRREWADKRLERWVPKPVTPKVAETVQTIRSTLQSIQLGVKARPTNNSSESIATAEITDNLAPLIHQEHMMDQVMREADYWFITNGNALLQLTWDKDPRFNRAFIPYEQCLTCGQTSTPKEILDNNNSCPKPAKMDPMMMGDPAMAGLMGAGGQPQVDPMTGQPMPPPMCGGTQFQKAENPDGSPMGEWKAFGKGKTIARSPFEWAVPPNVTRFDEAPYIIIMQWRDKHDYEANHPELMGRIQWEKAPSDRSLQLYKSLAMTNEVGTGSQFSFFGSSGGQTVEGITEYTLWMKPTPTFPEGFVMRVAGEKNPILVESQDEGMPGPIPFKDVEGQVLWPFCHAQYDHVGGRLYGRSAINPILQKNDQINQIDSMILMMVQRTSNPGWVIPEGAGIDKITGEPGLIIKWNPLAAGGNNNAKPERIEGSNIPGALFTLRQQYLDEIEALSGTYDVIKGQKPTGIEAFSALQLLVERSQSRFTAAFGSRGEMYRRWFSIALELERQFGPEERVHTVVGPNSGYTFRHFQNAQLQGAIRIVVEDGSNMPKTTLGKRASIEQANQLQLLNPGDPDQRYALLQQFGLSDLVPSLDYHVKAALYIQDQFERWVQMPEGPPPLVFKPWYDPIIHYQERIKWLNTDKMREMLEANPGLEPLIAMHLQELQFNAMPPPVDPMTGQPMTPPGPGGAGLGAGGGMALANSNNNSGGNQPKGNAESGPNVGPA